MMNTFYDIFFYKFHFHDRKVFFFYKILKVLPKNSKSAKFQFLPNNRKENQWCAMHCFNVCFECNTLQKKTKMTYQGLHNVSPPPPHYLFILIDRPFI